MQRPTTTARFSEEHLINVLEDSSDEDAVSDSHPLYKKHSQLITAERMIHLIPLILILCFLLLWIFSHPADLVVKNGSHGVQHNETVSIRLDFPLMDFSLLKPVSTSQAPAPQNQVSFTQL